LNDLQPALLVTDTNRKRKYADKAREYHNSRYKNDSDFRERKKKRQKEYYRERLANTNVCNM